MILVGGTSAVPLCMSDCFDVIIMYKLLPDSVKFILSKSTDTSPESRV